MSDYHFANCIIERLREEYDCCKQDGADDIALLLDEAAAEMCNLIRRCDNAERELSREYRRNHEPTQLETLPKDLP